MSDLYVSNNNWRAFIIASIVLLSAAAMTLYLIFAARKQPSLPTKQPQAPSVPNEPTQEQRAQESIVTLEKMVTERINGQPVDPKEIDAALSEIQAKHQESGKHEPSQNEIQTSLDNVSQMQK